MEKRVQQFHRIDYIQGDRIVGTRPVRDFVGQSYWTDHIFGSINLPCLTEDYVGNLRGSLVDRPLTRAINNWISERVIEWGQQMEKAAAKEKALEITEEKKRHIVEQMENLNKLSLNEIFDENRHVRSRLFLEYPRYI